MSFERLYRSADLGDHRAAEQLFIEGRRHNNKDAVTIAIKALRAHREKNSLRDFLPLPEGQVAHTLDAILALVEPHESNGDMVVRPDNIIAFEGEDGLPVVCGIDCSALTMSSELVRRSAFCFPECPSPSLCSCTFDLRALIDIRDRITRNIATPWDDQSNDPVRATLLWMALLMCEMLLGPMMKPVEELQGSVAIRNPIWSFRQDSWLTRLVPERQHVWSRLSKVEEWQRIRDAALDDSERGFRSAREMRQALEKMTSSSPLSRLAARLRRR